MVKAKAKGEATCTVTAKVIRADGTEEDLGVISVSTVDADKMAALIEELRPEAGGVDPEEVARRNEEESRRNIEESARIAAEDAKRHRGGE